MQLTEQDTKLTDVFSLIKVQLAILENDRIQAVNLIKVTLLELRLLLFICGFEEEQQSFMRFIGVIEDVLVYCHHFTMTNEWMVKKP